MAINPLYIPLFTLEEIILDKDTGLPLSGGVVTFYRDSQRTTLKPIFQISGVSPNYTFTNVGSQFVLGIAGNFVDGNGNPFVPYAFPYDAANQPDLYFVTVVSAGGVAQFTREAVPYTGNNSNNPENRSNTDNELANPQFVEVLFPSSGSFTINVTGANIVTQVAPDWDLITSGTGTVTLERLQPIASGVPTNPPYALSIAASGTLGASVTLRQRLYKSPSLLRGGFASGMFAVAVLSGGSSSISMQYAPSAGTPINIIPNTLISVDGSFHVIANNVEIPDQANDPADAGWVDINIIIPTSRTIAISSIQVVGIGTAINVPFDEQSAARQVDQLFHYYQNGAVHQPKKNILTGWLFAVNPWQFYSTTHGNVATNEYTADQTILIQQNFVASATGNNVAVSRGTFAQNYGYIVTSVTATNKFAMLQYIDPSIARPFWGRRLSVMVKASVLRGTGHTTSPKFKLKLMWRNGLPVAPITQTDPVAAWTNVDDSIPTLTGWTFLDSVNDPEYTLTPGLQDFKFERFVLPASAGDDMTLGVMLVMMNNLNQDTNPDSILVDSISLVDNDFAVEASAETYDESLAKCRFYYETSYPKGEVPGISITGDNQVIKTVLTVTNGGNSDLHLQSFNLDYMQTKRKNPVFTIYRPGQVDVNSFSIFIYRNAGVIASVTGPVNPLFATFYNIIPISLDRAFFICKSTVGVPVSAPTTATGDESTAQFHYVADARLGKV